MSEQTEAQTIVDTALEAAAPTRLDPDGHLQAFVVPSGARVELVDVQATRERWRERPTRKIGAYAAHDADSFAAYIGKHARPEAEVWADVEKQQVVGVINAHAGDDDAGWSDHRVTFTVKQTPAWRRWTAHDGTLMSQSDFAELIEDRSVDVITPAAADMLELAQTFQASIGVQFQSARQLSSGERQLTYRENVEATAGRTGQIEIPREFVLALKPFEGSDYRVTARFRYRITDGTLRIGYKLERPEDVMREAFLGVVDTIESRTDVVVYRGVSA